VNKFLIIGALILAAFASGRFSAPEKIKIETKIETKEVVVKDEHKDSNSRERIIEVTRPDGTKIKRTRTDTRRTENSETRREAIQSSEEKREITKGKGPVIQALFGIAPGDLTSGFDYGGMVTLPIIGPFYGGAFVFIEQQFKIGLSIGMEF
jgi:hypothetical protein